MNEEKKTSGSHGHSTLYIVVAIVAAIVIAIAGPTMFGESFRPVLAVLDVGGEVFLRMLQMVVVPLVMASVMSRTAVPDSHFPTTSAETGSGNEKASSNPRSPAFSAKLRMASAGAMTRATQGKKVHCKSRAA